MASALNITFPGNLAQVASLAVLRQVPTSLIEGDAAYLVAGEGIYTFAPGSLAAENGADVIKPNDRATLQAGRWLSADDEAGAKPNVYKTYAALLASDPSLGAATLVPQAGETEPAGNFSYINGQWVRQSAKGIGFVGLGAPAIQRSTESKGRDVFSITDALPDSAVDAIRALTHTDDVAPVLQLALDDLASRGGGTLFVPAGRYHLRSTVVIPANVSIQGDGMGWIRITGPTKGTEFYISHNSHGFRTIAPINSYTPSCNTLRDFSMYCENPNAHVGGMIYDQGGSYMRYERLFVQGGQYGVIWDQTEQSDIDGCIFQEQKHSGVWLVNGSDLNAGGVLGFTNRLAIRNCEFNQPQKFGVLDDGGLSHDFLSNNYNGCVVAAIRCAGFCNTNIVGGEIEYSGTADIIIARTSYNVPVRDVGAMQTVKVEGVFTTGGTGPGIIIEDAGLGPATVLAALDAANNHWRGTSGPLIKGGELAVEINTRGNVLGAGYTSVLQGRPARFSQAEAGRRTTAVLDPPVVADGGVYSAQYAFPSLRMTDAIIASFSNPLGAGVHLYAGPAAAGVAQVSIRNDSGSAIDIASGTLYLAIFPQEPF